MTSPAPLASTASAPVRRGWRASLTGRGRRVVLAIAALVLGAGLWAWAPWHRSNPLLTTPALALEGLQAQSLYFNGPAWGWLLKLKPDLLHANERTAEAPLVRSFTQAVQSPKLFRQLDRQERFDKLLLVGDPSQYRPLLEHLLETGDWTLAYVDHLAILFQRGGAAWEASQLDAALARLASASAHERAAVLAQTAAKLVAVRQPVAARSLLEAARALDPKVPEIWSTQARYHLERGEWKETEAAANHALELDPGDLSAMGTKAQALYSTKRFAEAYTLSHRLVERMPDDAAMLFYHAKIAHVARAYGEETRALRRLIALAEENDRPTSGYRVYLGQSLATVGEAEPAMEEFKRALADPDLPKDQRAFAKECIALIHSQGPK